MTVASASHTSLPPGPPGQPLLGNLINLQRDQLRFLRDSAQRYGDVVPLQFGPTRVVLFNHPNEIEDILAKKNRAFVKGRFYRLLAPLLGNGLFTSEGDFWLRQRRLAQPAFHRERIAGYARTMVDCTRDLADGFSDGQQTDLYSDMLALDVPHHHPRIVRCRRGARGHRRWRRSRRRHATVERRGKRISHCSFRPECRPSDASVCSRR